jgi:hypothetical protein
MATYALVALLTERSDQLPACETASKAHGVEGEGGQGGAGGRKDAVLIDALCHNVRRCATDVTYSHWVLRSHCLTTAKATWHSVHSSELLTNA